MPKLTSNLGSKSKLEIILKALDDKKVQGLETITLEGRTLIADYFVLGCGTSSIHMRALVEGVIEAMEKQARQRTRIEGEVSSDWVLLDYGDIVVHILTQEARERYDLESLWKSTEEVREGRELADEQKDSD